MDQTQNNSDIVDIPEVDAPPQGPTPEQMEQMAAFHEMMQRVNPMIGGAVEKGIDRVYAQKTWSHKDRDKIGQATMGAIAYYLPLDALAHPLFALSIALFAIATANADPEEQERRRLEATGELDETEEEIEAPKPKRGRPKGKKNGAGTTA